MSGEGWWVEAASIAKDVLLESWLYLAIGMSVKSRRRAWTSGKERH